MIDVDALTNGFQRINTAAGTRITFKGNPPDSFEGGVMFGTLAVGAVLDVVLPPNSRKDADKIFDALVGILVPVTEQMIARRKAAAELTAEEAELVAPLVS